MRWVNRFRSVLRLVLSPRRSNQDLDAEVHAHLDLLTEEKVLQGMSEADARRAARLELGGPEQMKQHVREGRWGAMLESFLRDVEVGIRGFWKQPGFTLVSVLSVALGIGAATAVFGVARSLLDEDPTGVTRPDEVVVLVATYTESQVWGMGLQQFREFQELQDVFTGIAAYNRRPEIVSTAVSGERINTQLTSGEYFSVLGVTPNIGRMLRPADDREGAPFVAVISHRFWRSRFGGDPNVVGKTLKIDGKWFRVVGVTPENFRDVERDYYSPTDLWVAFHSLYSEEFLRNVRTAGTRVIARLRPEMDLVQVRGRLAVIAQQISRSEGDLYHLESLDVWPASQVQIAPYARETTVQLLNVLMTVCVLITLASCFSVAGFLIARSSTRTEEMAVRLALGATRRRLVRQLFTESVLLAAAAGSIGIVFSIWLLDLLGGMPELFMRSPQMADTNFDPSIEMLGFAVGLVTLCTLLFGLLPALLASGRDPFADLKDPAPRWSWVGLRVTPRQVLLVSQVALSVVLAVAAGLYARGLARIAAIEPGYSTGSMLMARIDPGALNQEQRNFFYPEFLGRLNESPEVVSASIGWNPPFVIGRSFAARPEDPDVRIESGSTTAAPHFFRTHGLRMVSGREFDGTDGDADGLIINRLLAEQLWPSEDPVGRSVLYGSSLEEQRVITGVVDMDLCRWLLWGPAPCSWRPFPHNGSGYLRVRTEADPLVFLPTVRELIREIHPEVAISDVTTLDDHLGQITAVQRISAALTASLASLGVILVVVGCFSLFASMVRDSRRELAIRMALGASARTLILRISVRGIVLGAIGTSAGLIVASFLSARLADQLYEISHSDGLTYTAVGVGIVLTTLVASYLPARRVARTDPAIVLRHE